MKTTIKSILGYLLPYAIYTKLFAYDFKALVRFFSNVNYFRSNKKFKDIHRGERCFILCNGPSINQQDLKFLKDEIAISVSSGYLYKDYDEIAPIYHCLPQLTYTDKLTQDVLLDWLKEMSAKLKAKIVFLSDTEKSLVESNGLFLNQQIHYLNLGKIFDEPSSTITDISGICPKVVSVPIMALLMAQYMGFKRIYLLGTEHDSFMSMKYEYAFQPTVLKGTDPAVTAEGKIKGEIYSTLKSNTLLWEQYRYMKKIALANGIEIINLTEGGALDEFPRAKITDINWSLV